MEFSGSSEMYLNATCLLLEFSDLLLRNESYVEMEAAEALLHISFLCGLH